MSAKVRCLIVFDDDGDSYPKRSNDSPVHDQIRKIVKGTPMSVQLPELYRFKAFSVRKDHELLMFASEEEQYRTAISNPFVKSCKGALVLCLVGPDGNKDALTLAEAYTLPNRTHFIPPSFPCPL